MTLPVFIATTFGIIEYGWVFNQRAMVLQAMRDGCRTGALQHPESGLDPIDAADAAIRANLDVVGFPCDDRCDILLETDGFSPREALRCEVRYEYTDITGLIPAPERLVAASRLTLEVQR